MAGGDGTGTILRGAATTGRFWGGVNSGRDGGGVRDTVGAVLAETGGAGGDSKGFIVPADAGDASRDILLESAAVGTAGS